MLANVFVFSNVSFLTYFAFTGLGMMEEFFFQLHGVSHIFPRCIYMSYKHFLKKNSFFSHFLFFFHNKSNVLHEKHTSALHFFIKNIYIYYANLGLNANIAFEGRGL